MRDVLYAVSVRLNDLLAFDNLPDAQNDFAEMFEMTSYGDEHQIKFYGHALWCTVQDPIPDVSEEEAIYQICLDRVVSLRSAILHLTSTIPNKAWT